MVAFHPYRSGGTRSPKEALHGRDRNKRHWGEKFSKLDLERDCSSSENSCCWLCDELENWNSVLNALQLTLTEWRVGKLQLRVQREDISARYQGLGAPYSREFFVVWLAKKHRCVEAISLEEGYSLGGVPAVPDSITRRASNLRHISVQKRPSHLRSVIDALAPIQQLESLEVGSDIIIDSALASKVADILSANSASVTKVDLSEVISSDEASEILMSGISNCCRLKELRIFAGMNPKALRYFRTLLRSMDSLRKLHLQEDVAIHGSSEDSDYEDTSLEEFHRRLFERCFAKILVELETNCSVQCLTIAGSGIDPMDISSSKGALLNLVLSKNQGLRSLSLRSCFIDNAGAQELSEGLRKNATLESLDVSSFCCFIPSRMLILCRSLEQNESLHILKIGLVDASPSERNELSAELARKQLYGRVQVRWVDTDTNGLICAMSEQLLCPTEVHLHTSEFSEMSFSALCLAVASTDYVKELTVDLSNAPSAHVASLRRMLESNRSVRPLCLHDLWSHRCFSVIAPQGLSSNKFVTDLEIACYNASSEAVEQLVTFLKASQNIHKLVFSCKPRLTTTPVILDAISQGLLHNFFITELDIGSITPSSRVSILRNIGCLSRAASFVLMQDVGKSCAEAFELLDSKASLISYVRATKEMTEMEAKCAVEAARKFIWNNYLFINNIAAHKVECYPGSSTQIDKLNFECWVAIAKHLRVYDVK